MSVSMRDIYEETGEDVEEGEEVIEEDDDVVKDEVEVEEEPDETEQPETETDTKSDETEETPNAEHAKIGKTFAENWARDPSGTLQALLGVMSEQERTAFLSSLNAPATSEPPTEPEKTYDIQSDVEALFMQERADYKKTVAELPKLAQSLQGLQAEVSHRDGFLHDVLVQTAIQAEVIATLAEALGLELPPLDKKAIEESLRDGKTTYTEAAQKHYKPALQKAKTTAKQAQKARPTTPRNASNAVPDLGGAKSMTEIFKALSGRSN